MVCRPQAQVRCKRLLVGDDPLDVFCCVWAFAYARSLMLLPFDAPEQSSLNSIPYDAQFSLYFRSIFTVVRKCHTLSRFEQVLDIQMADFFSVDLAAGGCFNELSHAIK